MGDARRAIDQRLEIALGSGDCKILEHCSARVHDGNHDRGQIFLKQQRPCHRQERNDVDSGAAGQEVANNRDKQSDSDRN